MESILEKLTLYDLLGYMLPGSLVILPVFILLEDVISGQTKVFEYTGIFMFCFLVLSYVCGILISEISRWMCGIIELIYKERGLNEKIGIDQVKIVEALKKAGIVDDVELESEELKKYFRYMYADIQCDKNYKRIHNYSSSETLYKNLSLAIFIDGLIISLQFINDCYSIGFFCVATIISLIFYLRCRKFCDKKTYYTIYFFVSKYITGKE